MSGITTPKHRNCTDIPNTKRQCATNARLGHNLRSSTPRMKLRDGFARPKGTFVMDTLSVSTGLDDSVSLCPEVRNREINTTSRANKRRTLLQDVPPGGHRSAMWWTVENG